MCKDSCWKLTEDERLPLVERAVYAAVPTCASFCSSYTRLQGTAMCGRTEYRAMVGQKVEKKHIRSSLT